uniref:ATP-dependent transporter ycf16 n=1 Tax=Eutreptiella gymnastica TaxID=73025 RepID=A0A7S1IAP7_9EUGL
MAEIYQKSLRLSNRARAAEPTGTILNHMAVDAEQMQGALNTLHVLWAAPLRILVAMVFLYQVLGPASIAGFVALVALLPLQLRAVERMGHYTRESRRHSDARVSLTTEILAGIRVIKSYVWEGAFLDRVAVAREQELHWIRKAAVMRTALNMVVSLSPLLLAFVSFSGYTLLGGTLSPVITFPALSLFVIIQLPLWFIPPAIQSMSQGKVALQRIEKFLLAEEAQPAISCPANPKNVIEMSDAIFSWYTADGAPSPCLRDVTLHIPKGELVCVVGPTGSGKSSLIMALLGETPRVAGELAMEGTVGYVSQKPWLYRGTLTDNILFGMEYDHGRYTHALKVCQLLEDVQQCPGGAEQEIGEGGANLSGGQRQRVSLARAVYKKADVYLLDDCLSALDAKVGRAVFEECICGDLAGTTRVWACNQPQYLPRADRIVLMQNGQIVENGTFEDLMRAGGEFAKLMQGYEGEVDLQAAKDWREVAKGLPPSDTPRAQAERSSTPALAPALVAEEKALSGNTLSRQNFLFYGAAVGGTFALVQVAGVYSLIETCRVGSSLWLTWWSGQRWLLPIKVWLAVYAIWGLWQTVFAFFNGLFLARRGVEAARRLHHRMLDRVMHSPVAFFDATPIGRMVNRFTKDQATIDTFLMPTLAAMTGSCAVLLSTTLLVVINTPYTCLTLVPLALFFYRTQRRFRRTARELKRMDAITRSPVYADFGEALGGTATIRAYQAQAHMVATNYHDLEDNQRFTYAINSLNRWLGVRLELIGSMVIFSTGCFAILQRHQLGAAVLGLTLSQTFQITSLLGFLIKISAEVENCFTSLERVREYTCLPVECKAHACSPPPSWPSEGAVVFREVVMRYRHDMAPSLRGLSFAIRPSEKIGIVGRTGAGKSSLLVAMYRFVELSNGAIEIDGLDIADQPLPTLRRAISIIPQDPILFSGTVRYNLDPAGEYTDAQIWAALSQSNFQDRVRQLPLQLDTDVGEGGGIFSVGGRQLLCLARALLRETRVIVIDEATANIDTVTDDLIQRTIRTQFAQSTVITIAHRLDTIIDSDRVLVLDHGKAVQFDSPRALLSVPQDQPSAFRDLVDESGPINAAKLRALANAGARDPGDLQSLG